MRERQRSLALAAVLALVIVACGGGGATTTTTAAPTTTATTAASTTTETTAASIAFDIGVDETTIHVGLLADLNGIFSPLVLPACLMAAASTYIAS